MNQVRISETPFSWLYSHLNYHDTFLIFAVRIWVKCLSSLHNLLMVFQACKTYPACCVIDDGSARNNSRYSVSFDAKFPLCPLVVSAEYIDRVLPSSNIIVSIFIHISACPCLITYSRMRVENKTC